MVPGHPARTMALCAHQPASDHFVMSDGTCVHTKLVPERVTIPDGACLHTKLVPGHVVFFGGICLPGKLAAALLHCLQVQANVVALNEAALRISQKLQAALGKAGDQGASTGRCAPACWVGLNCNGLMGGRQQAGV